ncbi:MAG TPA: hypothetical protein VFM34_06300 [Moraxellaceae bacterium]|nr:hypothetical protein [Moraxellaceae bacterium]
MTEYLAENSRLRQLSRHYSEGQLSLEEFRAARREILESLEAGRVQTSAAGRHDAPEQVATSPALRAQAEDDAVFLKTMPPHVPVAEAAVAAPAVAAGWDSHTRILAVVLGVAFVLALGALFYVFAL